LSSLLSPRSATPPISTLSLHDALPICELAYAELKRAFHDREVDKVYHTVVEGRLDPLEGTIDAPVGRHPGSRWKFAVVTDGKRRSEEHTSELQSRENLVCRLLLEKKKK